MIPKIFITLLYVIVVILSDKVFGVYNETRDGGQNSLQFSEGGAKNLNTASLTPQTSPSLQSSTQSTSSTSRSHLDDSNYRYFDNGTISELNNGAPIINHTSNTSSIKPRKGAEYTGRIVARKGVNVSEPVVEDVPETNISVNSTCSCCNSTLHILKCSECKSNNSLISNYCQICNTNLNCSFVCCDNSVKDHTTTGNIVKSSINVTNDTVTSTTTTTTIAPHIVRLKPKHTEVPDENIVYKARPNNIETGYLVPILISILVVPFVIMFMLFLYKKGKEYWEKRNYKRMDFLIDEIYNN